MIAYMDELPGDLFAREKLLDRAFGPARFRKSSEKIRSGRLPAEGLALVARDDDRLVGSVRLWHAAAGRAGGRPQRRSAHCLAAIAVTSGPNQAR